MLPQQTVNHVELANSYKSISQQVTLDPLSLEGCNHMLDIIAHGWARPGITWHTDLSEAEELPCG